MLRSIGRAWTHGRARLQPPRAPLQRSTSVGQLVSTLRCPTEYEVSCGPPTQKTILYNTPEEHQRNIMMGFRAVGPNGQGRELFGKIVRQVLEGQSFGSQSGLWAAVKRLGADLFGPPAAGWHCRRQRTGGPLPVASPSAAADEAAAPELSRCAMCRPGPTPCGRRISGCSLSVLIQSGHPAHCGQTAGRSAPVLLLSCCVWWERSVMAEGEGCGGGGEGGEQQSNRALGTPCWLGGSERRLCGPVRGRALPLRRTSLCARVASVVTRSACTSSASSSACLVFGRRYSSAD